MGRKFTSCIHVIIAMLLSLVVVNAAEISLNLTQPTSDISISQNETFDVTVDITCLLGDCGEISAEADAVSQIVSTTEGDTPFYTLINPQIITLNENESASLTWQITAAGEPNTYSLKVQAQNADASSETNPFSVQILAQADTAPPEITITSPTETAYNTTSLQINVTISENGSVSYSLDGGANVSMGSGTSFNQNLNDLTEGRHTLTIYAADFAGNT
ncbi:MAG TPA: Ig-like domain-containing protein, partial [Candidatus Nanoarchaeia archaeon]|nr:Ig-like domain-containing protein [Candidatus Nanoarchaeia archaeon]